MKRAFYLSWASFLLIASYLSASDVLIVMGPSCSGKSTFAKALGNKLGDLWQVVDLDDVIEDAQKSGGQYLNSELDFLGIAVNKLLDTGKSVIIDTNTYRDGFEKTLHAVNIKRILVYCPLPELIKRDFRRTEKLKRSKRRAMIAKAFVMQSFADFFTLEQPSGAAIGHINRQEIDSILKDLSAPDFLEAVFFATLSTIKKDLFIIYARFLCDIYIDSSLTSDVQLVDDVIKRLDHSC